MDKTYKPEIIYVLLRAQTTDFCFSYNRVPIAASKDYETICNYAKKWCEYIRDYGDSIFSDPDEPLCIWTGYNYYTVGTPNQRERIIFRISEVKVLKDLNQKVDPNDKNW